MLEEQTQKLVQRLAAQGVDIKQKGDLTLISAVTGQVWQAKSYPNIRILPSVAARDRHSMMLNLMGYIAAHPSREYFRYAVMTCPAPVVSQGALRGEIQALSRRISKWASRVSSLGIDVLFRSIEFTYGTEADRMLEGRYPSQTGLFHVHANVIYWPRRRLSQYDWDRFYDITTTMMNGHWDDTQRLQSPDAVVRYRFKPNDLERIEDHDLPWLVAQTSRLKFHQPMGSFKEWVAELKAEGRKIVALRSNDDTTEYVEVYKNLRGKSVSNDDNVNRITTALCSPRSHLADNTANMIVGVTLPSRRFTPWAEPLVKVRNYLPAELTLSDVATFQAYSSAVRQFWDQAKAPEPAEALRFARETLGPDYVECDTSPFIVHLISSTVQATESDYKESNDSDDAATQEQNVNYIRECISSVHAPAEVPAATSLSENPFENVEASDAFPPSQSSASRSSIVFSLMMSFFLILLYCSSQRDATFWAAIHHSFKSLLLTYSLLV